MSEWFYGFLVGVCVGGSYVALSLWLADRSADSYADRIADWILPHLPARVRNWLEPKKAAPRVIVFGGFRCPCGNSLPPDRVCTGCGISYSLGTVGASEAVQW